MDQDEEQKEYGSNPLNGLAVSKDLIQDNKKQKVCLVYKWIREINLSRFKTLKLES